VDLGTEKAPGTKLAKSNFQLPTSNFLFLKTEGHVFSNPLYMSRNFNLVLYFTHWSIFSIINAILCGGLLQAEN
jgi:hypothetical protein